MKTIFNMILSCCIAFSMTGCVSRCFYYPTKEVYQTPSQCNLKYEEVNFRSKDGTILTGWFVPAIGKAKGTVVHFHGNAQNMTAHFSFVDWLPSEGFNVFVFDYRGYGKSEGTPDRQGVYQDSVAAIQYVQARPDVDPGKILVFGQSLGGANAIAALGNNDFQGIKAVVIESTFYSYRTIVRDRIAQVPIVSLLRWPLSFVIVGNKYSPGDVVDRIAPTPLLLIHGTADPVIDIHHSQWLYDAAKQPKQLWLLKNGGHTEAFVKNAGEYRKKLVHFFEVCLRDGNMNGELSR